MALQLAAFQLHPSIRTPKSRGLRATGFVSVLGLAVISWPAAGEALDPSSCKAKINSRDGTVLVQARSVSGTLRWGDRAGRAIFPLFDNSGTCVTPGNPKKCQLGPAGTTEQLSPPEACTVYLKDTGDGSNCSAYIKRCIPGRRPCPSSMIDVGGSCIDKYEASVWSSPTSATQYGTSADDYPCGDDGQDCTNIFARSVEGVTPSAFVTWFQAQQACQNVGKRLPTNAEWQQAVAGTPDGGPCVVSATGPSPAGAAGCVSNLGAHDMVGNLVEWVAEWVAAPTASPGWGSFSDDQMELSGASTTAEGPAALIRGGSFHDGDGLTPGETAGPFQIRAPDAPSHSSAFLGFRCAR